MYKIETTFPLHGFLDTRIGGRQENQDYCGFSNTPLGSLFIVCDGMGGLEDGSIASSTATNTIISTILEANPNEYPDIVIREAVECANDAILELSKSSESGSMGTTLTLILINNECAYVTYLGDSRIYQLRKGKKVFRTFDNSYVFELVKSHVITEEQARTANNSNVITKALGISDTIEFDVVKLPYDKNDRFLLCTDGFWGSYPEPQIIQFVSGGNDLRLTLERAMRKVEKAGQLEKNSQHDNYSAILFEVNTYSKYRSKVEKKFKILSAVLLFLLAASLAYIFRLKSETRVSDEKYEQMTAMIDSLSNVNVEKSKTPQPAGKTSTSKKGTNKDNGKNANNTGRKK